MLPDVSAAEGSRTGEIAEEEGPEEGSPELQVEWSVDTSLSAVEQMRQRRKWDYLKMQSNIIRDSILENPHSLDTAIIIEELLTDLKNVYHYEEPGALAIRNAFEEYGVKLRQLHSFDKEKRRKEMAAELEARLEISEKEQAESSDYLSSLREQLKSRIEDLEQSSLTWSHLNFEIDQSEKRREELFLEMTKLEQHIASLKKKKPALMQDRAKLNEAKEQAEAKLKEEEELHQKKAQEVTSIKDSLAQVDLALQSEEAFFEARQNRLLEKIKKMGIWRAGSEA